MAVTMKRIKSEGGMTLIEVLVVLVILGLLATIAVPQLLSYRKRGYEAAVKSDLKNAAAAEEAYFSQNMTYRSGSLTSENLTGYNKGADITIMAVLVGSNTFALTATHANCPGVSWSYNSAEGTIGDTSCP